MHIFTKIWLWYDMIYLSLLSSPKDISEFFPTRKKLHRYTTVEMYGCRNVYIRMLTFPCEPKGSLLSLTAPNRCVFFKQRLCQIRIWILHGLFEIMHIFTKIARYLSLLSSPKDISEFFPTRRKLHRYTTVEMYGCRNVYIRMLTFPCEPKGSLLSPTDVPYLRGSEDDLLVTGGATEDLESRPYRNSRWSDG